MIDADGRGAERPPRVVNAKRDVEQGTGARPRKGWDIMLNGTQIKTIEGQLNSLADVFYDTRNNEVKERNRGYCQGIAFVLAEIDYSIEWEDRKAHIVKETRKTGNTREIVERLPQNVRATLEGFRRDYKGGVIDHSIIRTRAAAYFNGLRDAGLITENERKVLTCYSTI